MRQKATKAGGSDCLESIPLGFLNVYEFGRWRLNEEFHTVGQSPSTSSRVPPFYGYLVHLVVCTNGFCNETCSAQCVLFGAAMKPVPRKKVDEENSISDLKKENIGKIPYKNTPKIALFGSYKFAEVKIHQSVKMPTIKRLTLYVDTWRKTSICDFVLLPNS